MYLQMFVVKSTASALRATAWIVDHWLPFFNRGKPFVVQVYPLEAKRTDAQNWRYWNVVLRQIEQQAWLDGRRRHRAWWHQYFALMFNPIEDEHGHVVPGSTSQLSIAVFNRYMHEVEQFAMQDLAVEFDDDLTPLDFGAGVSL